MTNSLLGISFALLSTMSWALCSIFFKYLGERIDAIGLTAIKALFSSLLLLLIIFISKISIGIEPRYIALIATSGIIGIVIGDSLFFASLNKLSPFVLSLIMFMGPDLFSGIFGIVFLNEIPSLISCVGIILLLAGLLFIIKIDKNINNIKTKFIGIIYALLSLVATSYSMVIIKPILIKTPVITVTFYRMLFSAIVLAIFGLFSKKVFIWKDTLSDKKYCLKLLATITLVTIGGFWLSLLAIKYCQLIIASSLMMLEPFFIIIFMLLFNKYIPNKKEILGMLLIVTGIIVICHG